MKSVSRLFETFAPDHYDLSLKLSRSARTISGTVTLHGEAKQANGSLRIHAKKLTIESVTVNGKNADFHEEVNDELVISHPSIIDGAFVIVIVYTASITDDMNGVYPCYFEVDGKKEELLATQFESHYARQAFPCIDEPEAKATFDVTIAVEEDVTVLGNMPVKKKSKDGSWYVTQFETTPRMSSYLVAWVAGELQKKSATSKSGIEVSVWSTKAHDPSNLDFALGIATRTIDFFNDFFGVEYPLPKSDHVALPDFSAGAMENWGLITYREIALLVDPVSTTLSTKHYVATVIAHELSHQWFGNLVTMKWWNDLWLNESFADMMEYVAVDALEPEWGIWLDFATSEVISALRRDSLDGVQPIQIDVNHPDEISTVFDPSIVYAKGGRLLRMLQAYIGNEALRKGLKHYFETHQYTNTQADDLWAALSDTSGKDIASFMHAWMTQSGFPVVSAQKDQDTIRLSQEQFFIGPHTKSAQTWPIPLHGASKDIPESLQAKELSFSYTDTTPFRLNSEGTAHFITHYDPTLFADIIKNLDSLSSIDKLHILHEQLMLAKAGRQSYAEILPLFAHFKNETNESVWSIVSLAINELKRFVETDETAEAALKAMARSTAFTQYTRLGWDQKKDEDENDTKLRSLIISLMLYGEDASASKEAQKRFNAGPLTALDAELRTAIMAHVVRYEAAPGVVDALIEAYPKTTNSEFRDDIGSALTATRNQEVIDRLIELLKDTTFVRSQDFIHWFVWLLRNRYSREKTWQWARNNWQWIVDTFEGDSHYDMFPRYIASCLMTRQQYEEYSTFFKQFEDEIALARTIMVGKTELQGLVELIEKDGPVVRDALLNFSQN